MKSLKLTSIFIFLSFFSIGQNINLLEFISLNQKKSFSDIHQYLANKGWDFYSSDNQDNEDKIASMQWSYLLNKENRKAIGWLHLYSYKKTPAKLTIQFSSLQMYNTFKEGLKTTNLKFISNEISENNILSKYSNAYVDVILETKKSEVEDEEELTFYLVSLIVKGSVFDEQNGIEINYDDDGKKISEYQLKNGLHNGPVQFYTGNALSSTGAMLDGIKNGHFIEYNTDGKIISESNYFKGQLNGLKTINHFKQNGALIKFTSKMYYKNDTLHGYYQHYYNDTLAISNYLNGKIDGKYTWYRVVNDIDTFKIAYSHYENGVNNGEHCNYSANNTIQSIGSKKNGMKEGEWRFYFDDEIDKYDQNFKGRLYLIANFKDGIYNGNQTRYSRLTAEGIYKKYCEKANYVNGLLDGYFEKADSTSGKKTIGNYKAGQANGLWEYTTNFLKVEEKIVEQGDLKDSIKEGIWTVSKNGKLVSKINYNYGKKNGKSELFDREGKQNYILSYSNDQLKNIEYVKNGKVKSNYQVNFESNSELKLNAQYNRDTTIEITNFIISLKENKYDINDFESWFQKNRTSNSTIRETGNYVLKTLNDKIIVSGTKKDNNFVSYKIENFYSQDIRVESDFTDEGELTSQRYIEITTNKPFSGKFYNYFDSGEISLKIHVKDGLRDGKTILYDRKGNKINVQNFELGILKN